MAVFKVTMIFREGEGGWSESWYWQTTSTLTTRVPVVIGPPQPNAIPELNLWFTVFEKRINLLPEQGIMRAARFADVSSPRAAYLDESVALLQPAPTVIRDLRRRALVCTAQAGDQLAYRRPVNIRGIPDEYCVFNDRGQSDVSRVLTLFGEYKQALQDAGACLRVLQKDLPGNINPRIPISKIEFIGEVPDVVITTATPHALSDGQSVRLSKVVTVDGVRSPPLNGVYEIVRYSAGGHDPALSFAIPFLWSSDYDGARYIGGGLSQYRTYTYPAMKTFRIDRWGSHRVSNPFGGGRGRSSKRRRRASIPVV